MIRRSKRVQVGCAIYQSLQSRAVRSGFGFVGLKPQSITFALACDGTEANSASGGNLMGRVGSFNYGFAANSIRHDYQYAYLGDAVMRYSISNKHTQALVHHGGMSRGSSGSRGMAWT